VIVCDTGPLVAAALYRDPDYHRCADLPLGTTDASVIALAERLEVPEVATLDHRHFTVVRPRHTKAFTLLP
jgi:predicted nucleic acid-binding protein